MQRSGVIALAKQAVGASGFRTGRMWKTVDLEAINTLSARGTTSGGQWVLLLGAQKTRVLREAGCT